MVLCPVPTKQSPYMEMIALITTSGIGLAGVVVAILALASRKKEVRKSHRREEELLFRQNVDSRFSDMNSNMENRFSEIRQEMREDKKELRQAMDKGFESVREDIRSLRP